MIQQIKKLWKTKNRPARSDLDILLSALSESQTLPERLEWLVRLLEWIRYEGAQDSHLEKDTGKIPSTRIRFLLMVLERNPPWKKEVAKLLRQIVRHISAVELFCETGMAKEYGFLGEFSDRLVQKFLPQSALDRDLTSLFIAMFPDDNDFLWIESIDAASFQKIVELFSFEEGEEEAGWNRLVPNIEDSLAYLVIQCRAVGLAPQILKRLEHTHFRESPFYHLTASLENFLQAFHSGDRFAFSLQASQFQQVVNRCEKEIAGVNKHLEEYGVSINIVYHLARLEAYLKRIDSLIHCLSLEKVEHHQVLLFLSTLVQDNQEMHSLRTLLSQNISLLARKLVERSAETGEHYITRTKEEYRHMLQAAGGGGLITALTVYVKAFILSLHMAGFVQGAFASLNYAVSFVAIHLCGFTLGTKQPAMTGPVLAEKLREAWTENGMENLVNEIAHLIRSQVASVFGNVFSVVPAVLVMDMIVHAVFGWHLAGEATAHHAIEAADIFGPTLLYAAFTGVLLWASSIMAGWSDNWFALRGLRKALAYNPRLNKAFGRAGARGIARFFEKNMSGLVGNASLGVLMGLVPEILTFMGLFLEVRHVTLSSGSLAAAVPVLGWDLVREPIFWRGVAGIFFIGFLNVSVSFSLALWVAARATEVPWVQKKAIWKALWRRFCRSPWSFFFPVGKTVHEAH